MKFMIITEIYYAMALVFIMTYPALRIEIPTFKILLLLKKAKSTGLKKLKLKELMSESELFTDCLKNLSNEGLISHNDGIICIKFPGKVFANLFIHYRRLLGFSTGRG